MLAHDPMSKPVALALAALVATTFTADVAFILSTAQYAAEIVAYRGVAVSVLTVIITLIILPVFAALFGFIAAFVVLGAGFCIIRNSQHRRDYIYAGGLAGFFHTSCGLALRSQLSVADLSHREVWRWLELSGGFHLSLSASPHAANTLIMFLAAIIGGALAGWSYSKLARIG
ncbi:MAG: hypothetical protein B7Y88_10450 [Sphingomonadales bacterium 32-64-17]|nr:MAG: hypothetical protein B7Y88_10450 [Sphingomonadales bacterium 32-64-17]